MRFVICAIVLFSVIAFAFAQGQKHCLDDTFTAKAIMIEAAKDYDDEHLIWFDATAQKQRIDLHQFEPVEKFESVYLRYDLGKMFIVNKKTGECQTRNLSGKMEPFCLSENATHAGTITLGGRLKCEIFEETQFGFDIRLVLSSTGVPVNIVTSGGHQHYTYQEWFDYTKSIADPSVFNQPASCKTDVTRNAEDSSVDVKSTLNKVLALISGYQKQ